MTLTIVTLMTMMTIVTMMMKNGLTIISLLRCLLSDASFATYLQSNLRIINVATKQTKNTRENKTPPEQPEKNATKQAIKTEKKTIVFFQPHYHEGNSVSNLQLFTRPFQKWFFWP